MRSKYRWFVVAVFFTFMLVHNADRFLIGPLTTPIMEQFGINEAQMGAVVTGALLVATIFYLVWGYLYDRFARAKLLALASFIWGCTTWLSALAPNYTLFVASRAATGIDDASYSGLYSLVSDYFGPRKRGRIYGLLQISLPLGFLLGLILASTIGGVWGWRKVFYFAGAAGILIAVVIFFGVREVPRGQAEPELADLEAIGRYRFDLETAKGLFRKSTLLLLFAQGFFGVFPWNVLTYWAFRYLETERAYDTGQATLTMALAVIVLAVGNFLGGALGDFAFNRTRRGRLLVSIIGVLLGAVFLWLALSVPVGSESQFLLLWLLTAFFMALPPANTPATVHDITEPEVRSTALSIQYFVENVGAATAPFLAGLIAVGSSLGDAFLYIGVGAWALSALLLGVAAYLVPKDIESLRRLMRERADEARQMGA
jgi:MFS family permease